MRLNHFKTSNWIAALALAAAASASAEIVTTISDFEARDNNANIIPDATTWDLYNDRDSFGESIITSADTATGNSFIDSTSFDVGYGGSGSSIKLSYVFGADRPHDVGDTVGWDQEVYMETSALYSDTAMGGLEFTGATKFTFWAKADKPTQIRFYMPQTDIVDYAPWGELFTLTTTWAMYTVNLSDTANFVQAETDTPVPFDINSITALGFDISKGGANTAINNGTVWIDDIKVYGWQYVSAGIRGVNKDKSFAGRSRLENGNVFHISMPSVYKNSQGSVGVFSASGRAYGQSRFAKGQADVKVKLNGNFQTNGHFFYKVFPDITTH